MLAINSIDQYSTEASSLIVSTLAASNTLHTILKVLELTLHLLHDTGILTGNIGSSTLGVNVLTVNHLLDDGSQARLDVSVGQFRIRGRVGNCLLAKIVKGDNNTEHTHGLGKRTGEIVLREGVLGKEILTDKLGNLHDNLLILRQTLLSNQLHNLGKVILLLKNVTSLVTKVRVTRVHVVEVRLQNLHVLGVRNKPVKRGKVLPLSKLLIQSPKDLDDGKSSSRNGIGEITTGRRDCPYHGNGTLTIGRSKTGDTSGTFVKGSKTSSKVGGVS
mmetsp:Transcript_7788/g.17324  ORF Transcript_7788/g.17324 Transcript_7788/m.17324 type:complete len:274 (+) Transcript_7788:79-900(+)